ncbi:hypothetical protein DFS33DRAFT_1049833 [Desarmillaria ectypa]|nr:hypothetical protein DFS33DRAFT_1049833 [Desarmillaria ectypa]
MRTFSACYCIAGLGLLEGLVISSPNFFPSFPVSPLQNSVVVAQIFRRSSIIGTGKSKHDFYRALAMFQEADNLGRTSLLYTFNSPMMSNLLATGLKTGTEPEYFRRRPGENVTRRL